MTNRGGRNWPLRLLIAFAVLVGLAVAADRVSDLVAERIVGTSLQDSEQLAVRPDVSIDGFPFLTQLAAAHYDSVRITAHDVRVGPSVRTLDLSTVDVHLHDVRTTNNYATVRAAAATADARITFAALADTLGVQVLGSDGNGGLKATLSTKIAGQTVTGAVTAKVSASSSAGLRFTDVRASVGGTALPGVSAALGSAFDAAIPLSGLPFDITVTGLDVDSSGIVLHLVGHDLSYTRS